MSCTAWTADVQPAAVPRYCNLKIEFRRYLLELCKLEFKIRGNRNSQHDTFDYKNSSAEFEMVKGWQQAVAVP